MSDFSVRRYGETVHVLSSSKSSIHYPHFPPVCTCCTPCVQPCCATTPNIPRPFHSWENTIPHSLIQRHDITTPEDERQKKYRKSSVIVWNPQKAANDKKEAQKKAATQDQPDDDATGEKKNPWGNASYSDLIARAIDQSKFQKLTLPQIYDWFVINVPYFKAKEHLPSTKGWKNAIRHTLSLRQRFVRLPDPGNPYRSWWTVASDDVRRQRRRKPRWKSRGTQTNF
uniref:Forkhead domain protein O1-like protein n=2 Tax=Nematostella vectensis TaxID=45351 RepID=J7GXN6_NEMVE|nr:forkhead domain protein O1-like protein [Nematostella vectensis]